MNNFMHRWVDRGNGRDKVGDMGDTGPVTHAWVKLDFPTLDRPTLIPLINTTIVNSNSKLF